MLQPRVVPVVLALFLILAQQFDATAAWRVRELPRILAGTDPGEKVSPAPSPGPGSGSYSGGNESPAKEAGPASREGCLLSSEACHVKDLRACLLYDGNERNEAVLVLQNIGEAPLKVRATFSPANITSDEIQLDKEQIKEVNVTTKVLGSSSILVKGGVDDCVVRIKSSASGGNFYDKFPYASKVTPIHGVYLVFATFVLIGGVWACCKFRKNDRHVDGIAYQELEMGREEPNPMPRTDVETRDGWDEDWDDDWGDEIREVKSSPDRIRAGNGSVNGHKSTSSNKDGWEDNWDD